MPLPFRQFASQRPGTQPGERLVSLAGAEQSAGHRTVGVPGTGTPVTMQSVQILRFADGMASEWWGTADVFGVLRQIGARVAALT